MAIFDDKRELVRQAGYVPPTKATGFNKFVMAMAGYDDRGRRMKDRVSVLPGFSSINNAIAKAAAKGTDARDVVAAQTATEAAQDFNKLKFAGNIASTIFTGGASGLAKSVLGAGKNMIKPTPGVTPTGAAVSPSEGSPYMSTAVDATPVSSSENELLVPELNVLDMQAPGGENYTDFSWVNDFNNEIAQSKKRQANKDLRLAKRDARMDAAQSSVKSDLGLSSFLSGGLLNSAVGLATGAVTSRKVGESAYRDLLRNQRLENLNYL